jgi:hypothetical protein
MRVGLFWSVISSSVQKVGLCDALLHPAGFKSLIARSTNQNQETHINVLLSPTSQVSHRVRSFQATTLSLPFSRCTIIYYMRYSRSSEAGSPSTGQKVLRYPQQPSRSYPQPVQFTLHTRNLFIYIFFFTIGLSNQNLHSIS